METGTGIIVGLDWFTGRDWRWFLTGFGCQWETGTLGKFGVGRAGNFW